MNTLNGYSKSTLTDKNVLTASGGHLPLEQLHTIPYRSSFELYDTLPMILSGKKTLGNNCTVVTANENTAPHSKVWKITGYGSFYSPETMYFTPGETICIESWIMRPSGATGTAGVYYLGINFRDRQGKPINSNNGCIYFGQSSGWTCPCDGVWYRRYNEYTIPTSHTSYNGSDGGGFFSGTVRCLINYSAGTIPTYYGGFRIYKKNVNINATNTTNAKVLTNYFSARPSDCDQLWADGGLRHFLATSTMTTSKPPQDAHVLHFAWDNSKWESQLALGIGSNPRLFIRSQNGLNWSNWVTLLGSNNYTEYVYSKQDVDSAITTTQSYIRPSGYVTSSTANLDNYWAKLWEMDGIVAENKDITFYIHSAYQNLRGFVHINVRRNSSTADDGTVSYVWNIALKQISGNLPKDRFRLYYNSTSGLNNSGKVQLWCNVHSRWGVYNCQLISSTSRVGKEFLTNYGTLYSTNFATTQTLPSDRYIELSDANPITDYYWANIKISSSSNTATNPTFAIATATTSVTTPLVSSTGRLTLNAISTGLDLKFNNDDTKSVILNGTAFKPFENANNNLTLGSATAKWRTIYGYIGDFITKINTPRIDGYDTSGVYLFQKSEPIAVGSLGGAIGIGNSPSKYGMFLWGDGSGHGHIQVGRKDGTNTAYLLKLQEFGGNINIGSPNISPAKLNIKGSLFLDTGDATLKVYSGKTADAKDDGFIAMQTCIDQQDGETHSYAPTYPNREAILLQPRGGKVAIGTVPQGTSKLSVAGNISLYAPSGDSPRLIFQRGTITDGTYDWDQYVTGGTFKIRYNPGDATDPNNLKAKWTDVLHMYPSNITTPWNINITNTAGNIDTGVVVTGSTYSIKFAIGSGNINRGIYDKTNSVWMLYKDATNTYIPSWTNKGNSTTPVYFDSTGKPIAGTSYAKAIKGITRSGTTFTYTCVDGTTGTFTQQDNNTTYDLTPYFKYDSVLTNNSDANTLFNNRLYVNTIGNGSGNSNFPLSYGYLTTFGNGDATSYYGGWQLHTNASTLKFRTHWNHEWKSWVNILTDGNYTTYVNETNFPGLKKTGTVTSVTVTGANGLSGSGTVTTSGTITLSNAGVRSTTINGNYLRVNTNGTNADLTIPYATSAGSVAWANITGKPSSFTPSSHTHPYIPINAYNFTSGCLVKLNVASTSNSMISVHITGNAYSTSEQVKVINSIVEFYNYNDSNDILSYNATHFGYNFGAIKIFNYDNKVCLWFKQDHNYMSFSVFANYTNSSSAENVVSSISNSAMPTSGVTRLKTITPKTVAYSSDIPNVTNYYWADQKIGSSSSTSMTPTFGSLFLTGTAQPGSHNYLLEAYEKLDSVYTEKQITHNFNIAYDLDDEYITSSNTYDRNIYIPACGDIELVLGVNMTLMARSSVSTSSVNYDVLTDNVVIKFELIDIDTNEILDTFIPSISWGTEYLASDPENYYTYTRCVGGAIDSTVYYTNNSVRNINAKLVYKATMYKSSLRYAKLSSSGSFIWDSISTVIDLNSYVKTKFYVTRNVTQLNQSSHLYKTGFSFATKDAENNLGLVHSSPTQFIVQKGNYILKVNINGINISNDGGLTYKNLFD